MTANALIILGMLGGLFAAPYHPTTTQVYGEGEWRLTVATDAFTHQVHCRIENHAGWNPDITVEPGALAFHFSSRIDTSKAWYSIDGGAPSAWRDVQAGFVRTGAIADAERLDNPTGGVILMPIIPLRGAGRVTIQATPKSRPHEFKLGRFWSVIASAQGLGCRLVDLPAPSNIQRNF